MNRIWPIALSLVTLCSCASAPVPVDDNNFSFGNRNYKKAYSCTIKAMNATGFVAEPAQQANQVMGSMVPKDALDGNRFEAIFTLDERTRTVNASIKKHLGSNWSLVFDNKAEIDELLNKFQAAYESCL